MPTALSVLSSKSKSSLLSSFCCRRSVTDQTGVLLSATSACIAIQRVFSLRRSQAATLGVFVIYPEIFYRSKTTKFTFIWPILFVRKCCPTVSNIMLALIILLEDKNCCHQIDWLFPFYQTSRVIYPSSKNKICLTFGID